MIPTIIAYALNIIDYIFTAIWVAKFGIDIEVNPFGRWMFENNVAWVFKIVIVGILFAVLAYVTRKCPDMVFVSYILLTIFAAVVIYHIVILFTLLGI